MKKFLYITTLLLGISVAASAQKTTIIKDILKNTAVEKVVSMQQAIRFTDEQAQQLTEVEYRFLLDVQKAENCCMCNSAKRVEKLQRKKDESVQKILTREQFIKYDAIEKRKIKKHPAWAN